MKAPKHIQYNGKMYRLAAEPDAPAMNTDSISETSSNPAETKAAPAEPAAPATPAVPNKDVEALQSELNNISAASQDITSTLGTLVASLPDRNKSDEVLVLAQANVSRLLEAFKALSIKYKGYVQRNPVE
jgi:hypothetical protein